MSKRNAAVITLAALSSLSAAQAYAGGISGSFTGIVTSSDSFLGGPGSLNGQPITGTFSSQFTACQLLPGSATECLVPQMLVTFDIAGRNYSYGKSGYFPSSFTVTDTAAGQTLSLNPDNGDPHGIVVLNLAGPAHAFIDNGDPNTLHAGPVFAAGSNAFITARFDILASMQLTSVQVDGVAGVPEPSAWALMIAGFGLTGLGVRVRRRQLAA